MSEAQPRIKKLWKAFALLLGCFGIMLISDSIGLYLSGDYSTLVWLKLLIGIFLFGYAVCVWIMNKKSWIMSVYVLSGAVIFQGVIIGFYDRSIFEITLFFILIGYLFNLQNPHSKKLFLHETNAPENLDN